MKFIDLFETVTMKPQTKEDYKKAIDKANEIIKYAKERLKTKLAARDEGKLMSTKNGVSKKPTATEIKQYTQKYESMYNGIIYRCELAIKFHETIMPAFNEIKREFNAAADAKDIPTLKKCHTEFKELIIKYDLMKLSRDLKKTSTYTVEEGYPGKLIKAIDYMVAVRDYVPKEILSAGRTDAENATAAKRSAAARRAWGGF